MNKTSERLGEYAYKHENQHRVSMQTHKKLLQINKRTVNHFKKEKRDKIYDETIYKKVNLKT